MTIVQILAQITAACGVLGEPAELTCNLEQPNDGTHERVVPEWRGQWDGAEDRWLVLDGREVRAFVGEKCIAEAIPAWPYEPAQLRDMRAWLAGGPMPKRLSKP